MRGRPKQVTDGERQAEALERWARQPKTSQALALRYPNKVLRYYVQPDNGFITSELGLTRRRSAAGEIG